MHESSDAVGIALTSLGCEDHIALHVPSGLVVLAMRDLPREVGDEESRMTDPASGVIEYFGGREGLMTTFMGKDPEASAKESLNKRIEGPHESTHQGRRDIL